MISFPISISLIVIGSVSVFWSIYKSRFFLNNIFSMLVICGIILLTIGSSLVFIDAADNEMFGYFAVFLFLNAMLLSLLFFNDRLRKMSKMNKDSSLENIIKDLHSNKKSALTEARIRIGEVIKQDKVLHTINEISAMLFASNVKNYNKVLYECMGRLGVTFGVDRVYIWQNFTKDGSLYCGQVYEWSGGAEPQQGNELTMLIPFLESWYPDLSTNKCINRLVKDFAIKEEKELLEAQDIISLMVVPIFIEEEFWGFVGFDDCHKERVFTEEDEIILRSVSILFANSYLRNEMTKNLLVAKEEAQQSAKAKTDFLATISHEVRTPINAITGMSKIARGSTDRQKILECLDSVDLASRQLLSIINDILDMSQIDGGKFELISKPFNLLAALHNVKNIMSVHTIEKSQNFKVELDENVPEIIVGDDTRISQVLINLLSNAIKFTPKGGSVSMSINLIPEKGKNKEQLEFIVSDTGIGITEESQKRLFLKFEQVDNTTAREYGGTGLGLSLCKSILDMMGGTIEVDSAFGKGAVFTVRFPVTRGEIPCAKKPEKTEESAVDFAGRNVLLVEDIAINREIVVTLLSSVGINVDEAENGIIALEKIKASPEKYDAILMDIHMPLKDGYETTREIRSLKIPELKGIPIIAVTANALDADVKRSLDAGMDDHIGKPVNFEVLLDKLSIQFRKRETV